MKTVLITGVAGFIGSSLAHEILRSGDRVIGIDNLNDYYDVNLKKARLDRLSPWAGFSYHQINIADKIAMLSLADQFQDVTHVVHLAAQAGVRYSLQNPYAYIESNVLGFVTVLELARAIPDLKHFLYASSSSVYGGNTKIPFDVSDPVEKPLSLYAATKRADELMAYSYAHLYGMKCTGLRFFTVYGPWGRPDMAAYFFAKNIIEGKPIPVFNHGQMRRDFTYIDDIVAGTVACMDCSFSSQLNPASRVYNIGNAKTESLMDYIAAIEKALGKKAFIDLLPMQDGDVPSTSADISSSINDFGYSPTTTIDSGIPRFIEWFKFYHGVST